VCQLILGSAASGNFVDLAIHHHLVGCSTLYIFTFLTLFNNLGSFLLLLCSSWLCGCPTGRSHLMQGHSCNRFTKDEQKKSEIPASQGPTSQDFYHKMHYYERYGSHKDSLEKETLLQQNLQTWSLFLPTNQTDRANGEEIGILTGFEKLLLAQKVLTFTYPFAFYMFGNELADNDLKNKEIRQDLFEDQQKQLECCVEKLAMNLEGNLHLVASGEVADLKFGVISLSMLLDNCCRNLPTTFKLCLPFIQCFVLPCIPVPRFNEAIRQGLFSFLRYYFYKIHGNVLILYW
jgi:Ariadne domain